MFLSFFFSFVQFVNYFTYRMPNKWKTMLLFASKLIPLKNFAIYIIIEIIKRTIYISNKFYLFTTKRIWKFKLLKNKYQMLINNPTNIIESYYYPIITTFQKILRSRWKKGVPKSNFFAIFPSCSTARS